MDHPTATDIAGFALYVDERLEALRRAWHAADPFIREGLRQEADLMTAHLAEMRADREAWLRDLESRVVAGGVRARASGRYDGAPQPMSRAGGSYGPDLASGDFSENLRQSA